MSVLQASGQVATGEFVKQGEVFRDAEEYVEIMRGLWESLFGLL